MMEKMFLQVLNMSITASLVIVFVLAARLFLKKVPRAFTCALWSVVLFRLIFPFSFESMYSLLPVRTNPISLDIAYMQTPQIDTGFAYINNSVNSLLPAAAPYASVNPLQIWIYAGSLLWITGIAILIAYSLFSLARLQKRLRDSTLHEENIFVSDKIDTAFVIGLFHPKIYLPCNLEDEELRYILLHEQTHIRRFDHVTRLLSFTALCLHWFNPLVWAAFYFSSRDIEMACDEAVIRQLGSDIKKSYSASLLSISTGKRTSAASPLAFGEGDTRERISNVLNYKKPAFWVIGVALTVVLVIGVGLLADPKSEPVMLAPDDSISSINIQQIDGEISSQAINISDKADIALIVHALKNTRKTLRDSVNDYPNVESFLQIDMAGSTSQRFYLYNDGKNSYIEQPYVGIYRINAGDSSAIADFYASKTEALPQYDAAGLWNAKTEYVGNSSAVGRLVRLLPVPDGLKYDHIELQTSIQPYGISIYYSITEGSIDKYDTPDSKASGLFRKNALLLLSLVDNAGKISAVITDGERELEFISDREWADSIAGGDIREYAASPEKLQQLIELDRELVARGYMDAQKK